MELNKIPFHFKVFCSVAFSEDTPKMYKYIKILQHIFYISFKIVIATVDVLKKLSKLNHSKSADPDELHRKSLLELLFRKQYTKQRRQVHISSIIFLAIMKQAESHGVIVRDKLIYHIESNNLISKDQFGFRRGYFCHSTPTRLRPSTL